MCTNVQKVILFFNFRWMKYKIHPEWDFARLFKAIRSMHEYMSCCCGYKPRPSLLLSAQYTLTQSCLCSNFVDFVVVVIARTHTKGSHWTPKWQHLFSFHVSCWKWVFSLHMSPCGIWQGWHLSILDYTVAKSLHNHCRKIWFKSQCKKYPLLCDVGHVYAGRPTLDCLFSLVGTYAMEYGITQWCQHIQFMLTIHLVDILSGCQLIMLTKCLTDNS